VVFEDGDVRVLADLAGQGVLDGEAGGIGDVDHPAGAVAAFAGQVVAGFVLGERNALVDQPFDRAAAIFDDKAGCLAVVQPGTGDQRIFDVCFD